MVFTQHSNLENQDKRAKKDSRKRKKAKTNSPIPLSCGKGKHAEWPKCRVPQINILVLFVWENVPDHHGNCIYHRNLEAHAVLRRRPNNCTLAEGAPTKAALSGITISDTCSAFGSLGVSSVPRRDKRTAVKTHLQL